MDSWDFASEVPEGKAEAEPVAPVVDLQPGQHFGPFSLREELGRGGFGVVFRARESASRREVALKIMTRPLLARQRARFLREGELTAALQHPGIVRIHSAGEAEGLPYLSYELVPDGQTLTAFLRPERREEALDLLEQIAAALGHAHAGGVVHRDLKPENVLVTEEGQARVADFGLARRETDDALTRTGAIVGTPSHMSPEQFGTNKEVGPPADVWALGVLLYQALTGELPFQASALLELSIRVLQDPLELPSKRASGVSPALDALCARALAKTPSERFSDGAAFAEALRLARHGPDSSVPQGRYMRTLVGAACGVALVFGAAWFSTPTPSPAEERLRLALKTQAPALELRAALDAVSSDSDAKLRAAAHLSLANSGSATERAHHARSALALGGDLGQSGLALARALVAGGGDNPHELISALDHARRGGAPVALVAHFALEEAESLVVTGHKREALSLVRVRLGEPVSSPARERRLWSLRAQLELALDPSSAPGSLHELGARGGRADGAALEADALEAAGKDPRPLLEQALAADPGSWNLRTRLARRWLAEGRVATAYTVLAAEEPESAAPPSTLAVSWSRAGALPFVAALAEHPSRLMAPSKVPPLWREPIAQWAEREGSRLRGLAEWLEDPVPDAGDDALSPKVLRERAIALASLATQLAQKGGTRARVLALRARLGEAGLLAEAAQLAPEDPRVRLEQARSARDAQAWDQVLEALGKPSAEERAELLSLRGEALLRQGRAEESLSFLRAALGPREVHADRAEILAEALAALPAPDLVEAERLKARAALLRLAPQTSEALQRAMDARRAQVKDRPEVVALFKAAVDEAPLIHLGRLHYSRLNFLERGGHKILREFIWTGTQSVMDFPAVWRDMLHLSQGLLEDVYLTGLAARYPVQRREDRLFRLLIGVASVEFEEHHSAIPELSAGLEAWLREEPGNFTALRARVLLLLRVGHLAEAERELGILREIAPHDDVCEFYQLLSEAQRKRPVAELAQRVKDLDDGRFLVWKAPNWTIRLYPELVPYGGLPGFERLLGPRDK